MNVPQSNDLSAQDFFLCLSHYYWLLFISTALRRGRSNHMTDIKPVIGWCVVCNGFRLEVGCGCVDCSNHLMSCESALSQAREEGRREGMREAAGQYHKVMALLRSTKMEHGLCQPRSRRACTHCNAVDELNELISGYHGAPIELQAITRAAEGK